MAKRPGTGVSPSSSAAITAVIRSCTPPPAPLVGGGEMGELIRAKDWSQTALGPLGEWPFELRMAVRSVVESRFPMALLWGRDLLLIYNDASTVIAPERHPHALGRSTRETWPEVWPVLEPILTAVLDRGESVFLKDQLFRIDRQGRRDDAYFTLGCSPVRADDGTVLGVLVTLLETTHEVQGEARRKAEEALRDANARLVEADRRKNEFLGVLSHELRNPLAPIRNSAYILRQVEPGGPHARNAIEVIERQTAHLSRLIDDLLEVTRITQGRIRLQREILELNGLAQRCAADHREAFAAAGVELETHTASEPIHVEADSTRLTQIVGNLLTNAAKFTSRGGRTTLTTEQAGEQAVVRVRDTGVGMAPELLKRLFEPCVQADHTLDRSCGGLGLGLAVLKGLAELHGGTVTAHSDGLGRGSEFVVTLPAARQAGDRRGSERAAAVQNPRRILLVEDDADSAATLKLVLELHGHAVETAGSGVEAVEKARATKPDVVVCDIGLPGMDGFHVARALRSDASLSGMRLVALSGYSRPEDVEKAREAGFDLHLAKPVSPGELAKI